jgi:hypothetical protein
MKLRHLLQFPESQRALVEKEDLVDVGIMLHQQMAAAMHHGGEMGFGISFPQGLEDDRVGQGVANAGAGEAEDA